MNAKGLYICHFIRPLDVRRLEQVFARPKQGKAGVEFHPPRWLRVLAAFGYTEEELRQLDAHFAQRRPHG